MASLSPNVGDDVRQIVYAEQGTYAAVIEAAISGDMSDRGRRILLTQQGGYIANILGILASDMPDSIRTLLLNANTGAVRSVTIRKVWGAKLTKADRALLRDAETSANRIITATIEKAGFDTDAMLFLTRLGLGDTGYQQSITGKIVLGALSKNQTALLHATDEFFDTTVAGKLDASALLGNSLRAVRFRKLLDANGLSLDSTLNAALNQDMLRGDQLRNKRFRKLLDANGLSFTSTLTGKTNMSLFSDPWRAKLLTASDLKFTSTLTGKASTYAFRATREGRLLDASNLWFNSTLTGKANTLKLTTRQYKLLDAANLAFKSTLKGNVDLSGLSDAQKTMLDAVNGSKNGKLTLGGSFTFDPSKSFETLLSDSIEVPMDAAKTAMNTLRGSLNDLRAAVTADTTSREVAMLEAQGAAAAMTLADSRSERRATADELRAIFSAAGVTSLGKGITFQNGQLTSDGYWSGTTGGFTQVMDALRSTYGVSGDTIAQLTSKVFASVNDPVASGKTDLSSLRKAYRDLTGEVASFDGGGQLANWGRSGGLDGKGGKMAVVHPNEKITTGAQNNDLLAKLDELVASNAALKAELRAFKEQSRMYDREQTKAVKETASLARKADVRGVTIASDQDPIPVETV